MIALALLFALGIVRMLGFAFLLVAYVLGPVMLPLGLLPETAGYCALWGKHSVKLLFWPAIWAVEFRLFDALREGLYLPQGSVGQAVLAPFAALGMLFVMFRTPLMLHSASFEGYVRTATRVVRPVAHRRWERWERGGLPQVRAWAPRVHRNRSRPQPPPQCHWHA